MRVVDACALVPGRVDGAWVMRRPAALAGGGMRAYIRSAQCACAAGIIMHHAARYATRVPCAWRPVWRRIGAATAHELTLASLLN